MNEEKLVKQLDHLNDWWSTAQVPKNKLKSFERRDLFFIKRDISKQEILAIIGPRQVGKTTLIYQTIQYLLTEKNINPSNILFISSDNEVLKLNSNDFLEDILNTYFKYRLKQPIGQSREKIYLFLDEIQSMDNWNYKLKNWVDQKLNIKIIVSGSSSTHILKGGNESLAGRMQTQLILPLKFLEVIQYKTNNETICDINENLREKLKKSIKLSNPTHLFNELNSINMTLTTTTKEQLQIYLNNYLLKGGYPSLLDTDNYYDLSRSLDNYIQSTIYRDIVRLYEIRRPKTLSALITYIAQSGAHAITYTKLSNHLKIRKETIESYLEYLENTFLISESDFYSTNLKVKQRNPKKIYIRDPGIRNSLLHQITDDLLKDPAELGIIAQTICYDHLKRLSFYLLKSENTDISYWHNGKEIDLILEGTKWNIPIEVKYTNQNKKDAIKEINKFINENKNKSPFGIIVTKNTLDLKDNTLLIPLWLFLLMC